MKLNLLSLRPITAGRALLKLFADPQATEHVFEIIEAMQGPALFGISRRFEATPEGRRLLAEKPDILPLLCDREALRRMPEGSLAHAYLAFVESEGITADGLVEASQLARPNATPELTWVRDWLRDTHDLWHTVLGYKGDLIGEAALLAFSHVNTGNIGVGLIAAVAWLRLGQVTDPSLHARDIVMEGRRVAKRVEWFIGVPWHEWLARPLEDVRRDLRVTRPAEYEPVRSTEVDVSLVA